MPVFRTVDVAIEGGMIVSQTFGSNVTTLVGQASSRHPATTPSLGVSETLTLLPMPDDADWLARVSHDPQAASSATEAEVSQQIERRRTYRKKFQARAVDPTTIDRLVNAATAEGAWLRPIEDGADREALAQLVAEGDAVQWSNASWRRELAA
jgi:hypothetical protein